jgi:hypothetical protein
MVAAIVPSKREARTTFPLDHCIARRFGVQLPTVTVAIVANGAGEVGVRDDCRLRGGFVVCDLDACRHPESDHRQLNREVALAIRSSDVNSKLVAGGVDPEALTPEQLGAKIRSETERWGKVVKAAGLKPQ